MDVVEQWLQQEGEDAVEQTVDCSHSAGTIGVYDGDDLAAIEGLHCLQDDRQPLQDRLRVERPYCQFAQRQPALLGHVLHSADPAVKLVQFLVDR